LYSYHNWEKYNNTKNDDNTILIKENVYFDDVFMMKSELKDGSIRDKIILIRIRKR
jgi:hypothetical protein